MKKLTIIIITLTIVAALTPSTATAETLGDTFSSILPQKTTYTFEPYIIVGTIDTAEQKHKEATAHKLMIGVGVKLNFDEEKQLQKLLKFETLAMAEPPDGDTEMAHDRMVLSGKLKYIIPITDTTVIYPIASLNIQKWRRNSPEDETQFWGDLIFTEGTVGVGLKREKFFAEIEANFPFWSTTDSGHKPKGDIGFNTQFGITPNERLSFGLFYNQNSFSGEGSQGDFDVELYGFFVGYKF